MIQLRLFGGNHPIGVDASEMKPASGWPFRAENGKGPLPASAETRIRIAVTRAEALRSGVRLRCYTTATISAVSAVESVVSANAGPASGIVGAAARAFSMAAADSQYQ